MMAELELPADAVILLRHIPGGSPYQGKPPPWITSENFKLRTNRQSGEQESGISVSQTVEARRLEDGRRLLTLRTTGPDSRMAYAALHDVQAAGFSVHSDPTDQDPSHCVIKSASAKLENHADRKKLAQLFHWLEPVAEDNECQSI